MWTRHSITIIVHCHSHHHSLYPPSLSAHQIHKIKPIIRIRPTFTFKMHFANCFDFLFAFPLEAFEAYLVFISSLTAGITLKLEEREAETIFLNRGSTSLLEPLDVLSGQGYFSSYNFAYLSSKVIFQILHPEL